MGEVSSMEASEYSRGGARKKAEELRRRQGRGRGAPGSGFPPLVHSLADGKRVHEPAVRPEIVWTAGQLPHRPRAEVALEDFAIVAYGFDHACSPGIVEPDKLAVAALDAEQTPDRGIIALLHRGEIRLRHPAFLGLDQGFDSPVDASRPLR